MPRLTHGEASQPGKPATSEYLRWCGAKGRCYNPKDRKFKYYGGRGIVMCDEWRDDYTAFLRDMGRCPAGLSLDRIDVDGPYSKDNCRWASIWTQRGNRRDSNALFCKRGHRFEGHNLGHEKANGRIRGRFCRACRREDTQGYAYRVKIRRLVDRLAMVLSGRPLPASGDASGASLRDDRSPGRV